MQETGLIIQPQRRNVQAAAIHSRSAGWNRVKVPSLLQNVVHSHKVRPLKTKNDQRSPAEKQLCTTLKIHQQGILERHHRADEGIRQFRK